MSARPTVAVALAELAEVGRLSLGWRERAIDALDAASGQQPPWYVRSLIGFGAWLSSLLGLVGLALVGALNEEAAGLVLGPMIAVGGVVLGRIAKGDFIVQLSLAASMLGLGVFGYGVGGTTESPVALAAATLVASALMFAAHPHAVMRYLSAKGAAAAAIGLGIALESPIAAEAGGVVVAWAAGLAWLETRGDSDDDSRAWRAWRGPAAYALAVATYVALGFSIVPEVADAWYTPVTPGGLGLGALALVGYLITAYGARWNRPPAMIGIAAIAALMVLAADAPGILAAVCGLAIGFHRQRWVMIGVSAVALIGFIIAWYYSLGITLLDKSIALMAGGLVLLAARAAVKRLT